MTAFLLKQVEFFEEKVKICDSVSNTTMAFRDFFLFGIATGYCQKCYKTKKGDDKIVNNSDI